MTIGAQSEFRRFVHAVPEPEQLLRKLKAAWDIARQDLSSEWIAKEHHWSGELSTSALSTATAISALVAASQAGAIQHQSVDRAHQAIQAGCDWLASHQNEDGGFGDTDRSHSNIATTLLVLAAWELADFTISVSADAERAWQYVDQQGRWDGLRHRYGKDKTFVVPILSNCALAGFVDWTQVSALPFEAAWLPQKWYRLARMPVVSYAIPAMVAIGQARFHFAPPKIPLLRSLRRRALKPTLSVLRNMQPESGGYLEAVPLTSFVLMNLAAVGNGALTVAQECLRFILDSMLADGSWPIDTNLATWVTSLSTCSLARRHSNLNISPTLSESVEVGQAATRTLDCSGIRDRLITARSVRWLLRCQHTRRHPFTGAEPGGWGWTNLSGAVPDADDTPAALLALSSVCFEAPQLARLKHEVRVAVGRG